QRIDAAPAASRSGGFGLWAGTLLEEAAHRPGHLRGLLLDLAAALPPGLGEVFEEVAEPRAAMGVVGREVGAGEEGLELGGEEERVRPAALAGQDLGRGHVDLVE